MRHRCIHTEKPLQNTLYYKACTKHFPVPLCTTKLAQSNSHYYFKACTKFAPVLLCTTKLAQTTSQYYFVLQSLHKVLPTTTFYYKACTKYSPVQHTTKLAQTTSQYYFVLQSLRKALPSTTLYRKACTHEYRCTHEVPSIAGCNNFTRKNAWLRSPTSTPKPAPCNSHAAITMCFAAPRTHPCTKGGNRLTSKRSKPQPPQTQSTLHRRLQPLHTEKRTVSCSGFLPKTSPMQQSCSHYNVFRSITCLARMP